jgi:hypothetical protein
MHPIAMREKNEMCNSVKVVVRAGILALAGFRFSNDGYRPR